MYLGIFKVFLLKLIYRGAIFKIDTINKELYLSFDDGPTPIITEEIINLLNKYNAKATFFCLSKNIIANPEIHNLIIENGHSIGNHGTNHLKGWNNDSKEYIIDFENASKTIKSDFLRPPYGKIKLKQFNQLKKKYKIIFWNCMPEDYLKNLNIDKAINDMKNNLKKGDIIVLHDSVKAYPNVYKLLSWILEYYTSKGYSFLTLD